MTEYRSYYYNPDIKVWAATSHNGIQYSDGDAVENRLLSALRKCSDLSGSSEELRLHITDWPSEYHLSPVRHNLLRPFSFKQSDRILELGCGCGAITRYLGETRATVVGVEGSRRRAEIAAERCRDLPNVSIYCDNIAEFRTDEKFDYITLIGVLEYAPLFIDSDNPVNFCLECARSFLKDDGLLIIAMENQLGLKYFNGSSEDHLGIPYFGINDLYTGKTPVTFGRKELSRRLQQTGFKNLRFFYPFPDYKLPEIILSEDAFLHRNFRPADLLYRLNSRDYGKTSQKVFFENLAWQPLERNGLIADLANSFLILADRSAVKLKSDWLAHVFSTDRIPAFAVDTVFQNEKDSIYVAKHRIFPQAPLPEEGHFRHRLPGRAPYVPGQLHAISLQSSMAGGGTIDDVVRWASPWVAYLSSKALPGNSLDLPGEYIDAIPANLLLDESGNLIYFDAEWFADGPIPLKWVLIRGLVNALSYSPLSPALAELTFRDLIKEVSARTGCEVTAEDIKSAANLEDKLQRTVFGQRWKGPKNIDLLSKQVRFYTSMTVQDELVRIKSTISWKITKPLRFLSFLLHRIINQCGKLSRNLKKE
ncbi:MAG: class I SAM-dependent methyltransferase [Proteobacteria bacterium]|nr:class I SAM-dependent methyltransferase [Pseudomonadota bacterium]